MRRPSNPLQRKPWLDDRRDGLELEADRTADAIAGAAGAVARTEATGVDRATLAARRAGRVPLGPEIDQALRSPARDLDTATRSAMETYLGHDFSRVRIHVGDQADRASRAIGARAFTRGADVVFAGGQYAPEHAAGRWLVAHELAHVVQQGAAPARGDGTPPAAAAPVPASLVQPAYFRIGSITVHVEYGDLLSVAPADYASTIESRFVAYTGAADATAIHPSLVALTPPQQRWVLYAIDLLQENTQAPRDDRLNRTEAVQRLIAHAPAAAHVFWTAGFAAEEEALRAAGWSEVALAGHLGVPTAAERTSVAGELNPPQAVAGAALDVPTFDSRMEAGLRTFLTARDPANWTSVGTDPLPTLQGIGDAVMDEARSFFSPLADAARASVFGLNPPFHIAPNIFSVTALVPDQDLRLGYLLNRANLVGRNATPSPPALPDTNIFRDVNYDGVRDRAELERLITTLEADPGVAATVDRLIRHTGRQSGRGAATTIGIVTEYDAGTRSECEARWRTVDTLCHEVLHALTHPDFRAAAAPQGFGQVMVEGFTEVLGTELFNDRVKPKAGRTPAFKAQIEAGLAGAPCPVPPDATVDYAEAGAGAQRIRATVGPKRFRAAYFLGQTHLLGI